MCIVPFNQLIINSNTEKNSLKLIERLFNKHKNLKQIRIYFKN